MNEKAQKRALPYRRCDVETAAFEKEISAQNCADVLTRALAPDVCRGLLSDHVHARRLCDGKPTRIQQCRTAKWSVGGRPDHDEEDNDSGCRHSAGLSMNDRLFDELVHGSSLHKCDVL